MEVDIIGDEQDNAVPKEAVAQQCQHLEHGDLGVAQVGEEVNEGRDTQPVAEAGANGCAHQGALPDNGVRCLHPMEEDGNQREDQHERSIEFTCNFLGKLTILTGIMDSRSLLRTWAGSTSK